MMYLSNFIKCYPNILSDDLCDKIITQDILNFEPARVRDNELSDDRKCFSKQLDDKFDKDIFNVIGQIIIQYKKEFRHFHTGANTEDTGYEHLLYKGSDKGEYTEHTDHMDLFPRVLSCSLILNDNYKGGDFSFFKGKHLVKKKKGSAVVFPSNFCFPHAITPVTKGDRHSIITWIH